MMNKENMNLTILYYSFKNNMKMMIADKNSMKHKYKIFREAIPVILKVDINSVLLYEDEINKSENGVNINYIVYDSSNNKYELNNFMNREDLYNLKNFPLILTLIVVTSFHGKINYSAPVGFLTFKDYVDYSIDKLPKTISRYMISDDFGKKEGFKKLSHSHELSNDRVIAKLDNNVSEYLYETLFGKDDTNNEWLDYSLEMHLRSLIVYDFDSDYSVDVDEISENLSVQVSERNPIANLKKVKLGFFKDDKVINIKRTNVILNKNKDKYYGHDADSVRLLEYQRLSDMFKNVDCDLVFMESFWVRTKIPGHTYVTDSDGNKQKTVFMKIDPRTHQLIDNILYLRNGDMIDNCGNIL